VLGSLRPRGLRVRHEGLPSGRRGRSVVAFAASVLSAASLLSSGQAAQAAPMSFNCGAGGDLQAKILAAASGSTILVKGTCFGNFDISGKTLTLKGNPTATLDGNDLGPVVTFNAAGKSLHLVGLTVTGGVAAFGAGISMPNGDLTLNKVTVTGNLASATSGTPGGGGILSGGGNVTLIGSTVSANRALATGGATDATGGGLFVNGGDLTVVNSVISGNRAAAVPASGLAEALGGGFYIDGGKLTIKGSTISGNRVIASTPSQGRAGGGGGYQASTSTDSVTGSIIASNIATATAPAGSAFVFAPGLSDAGTLHVTGSSISANVGIASSSDQATAIGGGLDVASITLTRSTVNGNRLRAVSTGDFAVAAAGGIDAAGEATVTASTISRNSATAKTTSAQDAANADGGGVQSATTLNLVNSTVAFNKLSASSPFSTLLRGGGLNVGNPTSLVNSTVAGNTTAASGGSPEREGGGVWVGGGTTFEATIVANNTGSNGPDCWGAPTSAGYNLIGHIAGCSFTKASTDKVGVDPKLGPLQGNGGPTQTMAIATASPARDAIPNASCPSSTDQRGVHRPQGPKCDIGAYERKLP